MDIIISRNENEVLIQIDGRVDTVNSHELEVKIKEVMADGCSKLLLDCANMSYISSSGLRVFLSTQKAIRAQEGKLIVKNISEPILEIFKMTGFISIFQVE